MPNTRISDLTAATSVAGTDVYPSVQTAGVGPVKTSLTQITAFALANAPAGAVATPSIAPTGDTNTGFWFPAADTIAASTGGSARLRIDNSGNVGIGTTSPAVLLDARGDASVGARSGYAELSLHGPSSLASSRTANFRKNWDSPFDFNIYASSGTSGSSAATVFYRDLSNETMRIDSAGRVGIGTASPGDRFVVENASANVKARISAGGSASYTASLALGTTTRDWEVTAGSSSSNYRFSLNYTGTDAPLSNIFVASNGGNVGIGTASPTQALYIERAGALAIQLANTTNSINILFGTNTTEAYVNAPNGALAFSAAGSERMRITSAGNLLVGTTSSPTTGTQCLTIETGTAPTATPADTVTFYSSDLSAGNTMPSFYTEGTIVGTGTPTADRTIAVRINGTVYYLLASTIP